MAVETSSTGALLLDRYRVYDEIAAGGMASVHIGTLVGDAGFSRTVAVKRLHPHYASDRSIVTMFTDEARIAARIRHPNVVTTLDVMTRDGEVFLIMEYVHGEPLSRLLVSASKRKEKVPPRIVAAIMSAALHGLHAAHEAKDARGRPLGIVHRDISPQNIIVGVDGISRVLDFGIARAAGRLYQTNDGAVKGKIAYMSPEQLMSESMDRRSDIYAAGVVLWESLTCKRLHVGAGEALIRDRMQRPHVDPPSTIIAELPTFFDEVCVRAMRRAPEERFQTALAMAEALEVPGMVAGISEVAAWVESLAKETLTERANLLERIENAERRRSLVSISDEATTDQLPKLVLPEIPGADTTVKVPKPPIAAEPLPEVEPTTAPDMDMRTTVPLRKDPLIAVASDIAPDAGQEEKKAEPIVPATPLIPRLPEPNSISSVDLPRLGPKVVENGSTVVIESRPETPMHWFWWVWIVVCVGMFFLSAGIAASLVK